MTTTNPSIWQFIIHADVIVKFVLFILVAASILSWTFILQRLSVYQEAKKSAKSFETRFWSGAHMKDLYQEIKTKKQDKNGMPAIFAAGYEEYTKLAQHENISPNAIMDGVQRAMRLTTTRSLEKLEQHLPFLATVGSTSPYIGLFGTVWGIMNSFMALSQVQQASIAMVAPGISEALIATAVGLAAAIPSVIAYNRFSSQLERIESQYDLFLESMVQLIHRDTHSEA